MPDIRFDGDNTSGTNLHPRKYSRMTGFFIRRSFGLIKTEKQAMVAQLVVAVVAFLIAGYFFSRSGTPQPPPRPAQDLINSPQPTRPLN